MTILTNMGRYSQAEAVLESARGCPPSHELDQALVRLYRFEGRLDEVRRLVRASWGRAPHPPVALRNLWTHDNSPFPVESWEDRALNNADQDDDRVWLGRAVVATLTGRFSDATRWLDACQKKRPEDPAVWRARLNLARAAEDVEGAKTALRHLAAEPFSELEVLTLRAWLEGASGDHDAERKTLTALVERYPGTTRAWERLATLAFESGQPKEAERLRRRKAVIDEAQDRYRKLIFVGDDPALHLTNSPG
jgi:tetratricopeptide (TPR) repeat protein